MCVSYFFDLGRHTDARDPGRRRHTDKVWNDESESPWRPAMSAAGAFVKRVHWLLSCLKFAGFSQSEASSERGDETAD